MEAAQKKPYWAPGHTGAPHEDFKIHIHPFCENTPQKYELCLGMPMVGCSDLPSPQPAHSHTTAVAKIKIILMLNKSSVGNCAKGENMHRNSAVPKQP